MMEVRGEMGDGSVSGKVGLSPRRAALTSVRSTGMARSIAALSEKASGIENDFPIEEIDLIALREGNSKRPVYRMHKWWARRLGSVFRMLLVTLLSDAETPKKGIVRRFWSDWQPEERPTVLDPFMGGGTTLFEALRLGARVVGSDINPVAWFLTKKEIEPVDTQALRDAFSRLEHRVGAEIKRLYRTTCPEGHPAEIMYAFWVKQIPCDGCGQTFDLWPNHWVARWPDRRTVVCPTCGAFFDIPPHAEKATCPVCHTEFDPAHGNSGRGFAVCPNCGKRHRLLDVVQRIGGPLPVRLFGIEGYCPTCDRRFLKPADEGDLERVRQAEAEWNRMKQDALYPRQEIPVDGRSDPRPVNHGYTHFSDLFLPRQLLALSTLLRGILEEEDVNLQEHLLLAFSDALDANNIFCKYEIDYHKISLLFGLHAYHPIERPTENNVWGTKFGRGTFSASFAKVLRGKEYALRPYERGKYKGERIGTVHPGVGRLAPDARRFIEGKGDVFVRCGDSSDLKDLPDGSVDYVVTDPPYFDNVMYSELADFFYVWLRLALKGRYPWFLPEHSRREEELVQNEREGKGIEYFSKTLASIWKEARRVLKDDGALTFTFHHNSPEAWAAMAKSLMDAGFVVISAPFVRSEGKSGFHSSRGNIRYDAILVCQKGNPVFPSAEEWNRSVPEVIGRARKWLERTASLDLPMNPGDILTALMGEALVFLLSPRLRAGPPVGVLSALSSLSEEAPRIGREVELRVPQQLAMFAEAEPDYASDSRDPEEN